ncbi:AraC family transcriptional regulator [Amycolatopsis mediterranei S699]|uniref:AraC family transcriptional regulator n=2 Tax=Amycolatopsis mediterranei TaxID=33910 RepID=A0A0H3D4R6_AMYMU|nr:helix-turn-helix domain-containing protein [Amycolatopsis mediterranei]ADJ45651.1 AraC family transcriptional regulator [Amycolatopsis mediterranei U32]AEK42430.1 AraC family transcriptional regulator [Amycolatopsis mediterranei S699]AFO77363.1 AraC family transcriptional regulator [Amycolatopsis mediterranei S699]AGT84491.1 AraC family transcriptional regulator [Amycolatopsis mediterranei RB]KDO05907.1 AraC family transcriptional regulator [Amycolatopsis mediterranei]
MRQQVFIVAFEGVRLGSLGTVSDAMALSDRYRDRVYGGHAFYPSGTEVSGLRVRVLTPTGDGVRAAAGIRLPADGRVGGDAIAKAVFLPAFDDLAVAADDVVRPPGWAAVLPWLRQQHAGGALLAAAGASVLALAEAGLLDGHETVACGRIAQDIETRHPAVSLLPGLPMLATGTLITAATLDGEQELARELVRRIGSPNQLAWLDEELGRRTPLDPVPDTTVRRFLQLARESYAEPDSIAAIAARLGTTERTLRRRCHAVLGENPSEVLRRLRLDAARIMLCRSSIPVERVGALVGYADAAAFRGQFRRRFGQSPSSVRRGAQ